MSTDDRYPEHKRKKTHVRYKYIASPHFDDRLAACDWDGEGVWQQRHDACLRAGRDLGEYCLHNRTFGMLTDKEIRDVLVGKSTNRHRHKNVTSWLKRAGLLRPCKGQPGVWYLYGYLDKNPTQADMRKRAEEHARKQRERRAKASS